ncbi:MAG: helix-turn-helix transcriptional regulator [Pseudomonadota bacterium]|nr:helix-turn-helix transcriptional regulator [Pseudomonadota bacterium]
MYTTNLLALRKSRKLTQAEVAVRAGISKSYYSELESGKKQLNHEKMDALAAALECAVAELLGELEPLMPTEPSVVVEGSQPNPYVTAAKLGSLSEADLQLVDQLIDRLVKK